MSPFEIFRRNLKPLMVFLTLLALFAFVVLPAMQSYLSKQAGIGTDPGVGMIDGTVVKASRVDYFTQNHQSTIRFLGELAQLTIQRGGVPRVPGFSYDSETKKVRAVGIASNPTQFATLRTLQFAAEAKKAGFELDDTAIKTWLNRYTDGKLSDGEILRVLMDSSRNRMGQFQLYEQLRSHLMAGVFQTSSVAGVQQGSFPILTPAEQWENFLKINRKATVQAYGVMVDDYMDKVNVQPSDAEIKAVYDEGINRYGSDQSPLPGFRQRDSATIEYVVADLKTLIDVEKKKFTEEQLREEYDKRVKAGVYDIKEEPKEEAEDAATETEASDSAAPKDNAKTSDGDAADAKATTDVKADEPEMKDATSAVDPAEATDAEAKDSEPKAATVEAPEKEEAESKEAFGKRMDEFQKELDAVEKEFKSEATEAAKPAEPAAKKEDAKPAETAEKQADTPAKAAAEDATDAVKDAIDAAKKASEESAEPVKEAVEEAVEDAAGAADQSSNFRDNGVQLVALLQDEKEVAETTTEAENPEAKTEDKAKDENAEAADADSSSDAEPKESKGDAEAKEDSEPKVKPFEEVRDEIATSLAEHPAKKRLEVIVSEANNAMKRYFNEYAIHSGSKKGDPPARPDLKKLAEKLGMGHKVIGPHDIESIAIEPIAQSRELGAVQFQRGPPFIAMMFGIENNQTFIPKKTLFSPLQTANDPEGKTYVSWKIAEVEDHAPPIDDEGDLKGCRDKVVEAIRRAEAKKLAIAAAEKIAEQVNAGKELADVIPEDKKANLKTDINPFSWNDAQGFQGVSIGNVPELNSVHEKFMKAVFTTEPGKASVGVNLPERVVYVVKPVSFQPHPDDLKDIFKSQPIQRMMGFALGSEKAGKIISGYYKKVDERTGFSVVQEQ